MAYNINLTCKVPENVLRQTIQRANNGHTVDGLIQSFQPYDLSKEQYEAIREILQLCAQQPDPHNAPKLYTQLVEVVNRKTQETTQATLQTDSNIGTLTIVKPESEDLPTGMTCKNTEVINSDSTCHISKLVDDVYCFIYAFLPDSKDYVALAKTCNLMNKMFCSPLVYNCFTDKMSTELSIQLHEGWLQIFNHSNDVGKNFFKNLLRRCKGPVLAKMPSSISDMAKQNASSKEFLKNSCGLTLDTTPQEEINKCLKIFSCAAAHLEDQHGDEFLIYAQKNLEIFKRTSLDYSQRFPKMLIGFWMDLLCVAICRDILFSFASQNLECITADNINKIVSGMKNLLSHDDVVNWQETDDELKYVVVEVILKHYSKELSSVHPEKLIEFGIDNLILRMCRNFALSKFLIQFQVDNNLGTLSKENFDLLITDIKSNIMDVYSFDAEIDEVKKIVKSWIQSTYTPEAIQQHAEWLTQVYQNDIFADEQLKESAEFFRSLL